MGLPLLSMAGREARQMRGIRFTDTVWDRVAERAALANQSPSEWVREATERALAAGPGGLVPPHQDAELTDSLDALRMAYAIRDPAEVVRMAVVAAARRLRMGLDPFRVPVEPAGVVTVPPKGRK